MNDLVAALLMLGLGIVVGGTLMYVVALRQHRKSERIAQYNIAALLVRMEKLERVRSTFVANVTHELKTPLTSIKGYVELLKSGPRDAQTTKDFLDIIDIEAERLHTLIDDILQLSEIENTKDDPRQQVCDLYALGQDLEDSFRLQAEKTQVSFAVRIPPNLTVRGSQHRLKQLLNNLIDNAIKYNKPGGSVVVRAWREPGMMVLRVSDTGIGIPEEHQSRIFERFYRIDKGRSRALGGTGLGLSIVKHVVQLYNGKIHIKSDPGKGTMFTVELPD